MRHQGALGSGWGAFELGVFGLVLTVCLGFALGIAIELGSPDFGEFVAIGEDGVWYSEGATRNEAKRLGEHLKSDGPFEDPQAQEGVLSKHDGMVVVAFFVTKTEMSSQDLYYYEDYATRLSEDVFDDQIVQIELRTEGNDVWKRIAPFSAAWTRKWQRSVDAAELAVQNEDYAAAERHYQAAVTIAEQHDALRRHLVWSLNNVANQRLNQGLVDEVKPLFLRAIGIAEHVCGKRSYEVGWALNGLGQWESYASKTPWRRS